MKAMTLFIAPPPPQKKKITVWLSLFVFFEPFFYPIEFPFRLPGFSIPYDYLGLPVLCRIFFLWFPFSNCSFYFPIGVQERLSKLVAVVNLLKENWRNEMQYPTSLFALIAGFDTLLVTFILTAPGWSLLASLWGKKEGTNDKNVIIGFLKTLRCTIESLYCLLLLTDWPKMFAPHSRPIREKCEVTWSRDGSMHLLYAAIGSWDLCLLWWGKVLVIVFVW